MIEALAATAELRLIKVLMFNNKIEAQAATAELRLPYFFSFNGFGI